MFVEKFLVGSLRITTYLLAVLLILLRATGADDESLARQKRTRERATLFESQAAEIAALRAQVAALTEHLNKRAEWVQYAVVITVYYIPCPNTSGQRSVSIQSIYPSSWQEPLAVQLASRRQANDSAEVRRARRIMNAIVPYILGRCCMSWPHFIADVRRSNWQEQLASPTLYNRVWWALP